MLAEATENVIVRSAYHQVVLGRIAATALRLCEGTNMICCFNPRRRAQIYNIYVQQQKKVQSPKLYLMDTIGGGVAYFTAQGQPPLPHRWILLGVGVLISPFRYNPPSPIESYRFFVVVRGLRMAV